MRNLIYTREAFRHISHGADRAQKADSNLVDRFELDLTVQGLVADINNTQDFWVIGLIKLALGDEWTAIERKKFHICFLEPATPMTSAQMVVQYNEPRAELPYVFSTLKMDNLPMVTGWGQVKPNLTISVDNSIPWPSSSW